MTEHSSKPPDNDAEKSLAVGQDRVLGLDLIRTIAILLVVLTHSVPGIRFQKGELFVRLLGFFGVELFFVLSGFLIGGILVKQLISGNFHSRQELFRFWQRRWFRTLPNFYLFLILNIFLTWSVQGGPPAELWRYFWFGQALANSHPSFFSESWSLAIEEWFYLVFPLLLFILVKLWRESAKALLVCAALFFIVAVLLRCFCDFGPWDDGVRKVVVLRLDAIMFGVALAYIYQVAKPFWLVLRKAWPIGVLIITGVVAYRLVHVFTETLFFDRVMIFSLTSLGWALLLPALSACSRVPKFLEAPVRCISLWSYSIYLCHGPLMGYVIHPVTHGFEGRFGKLLVFLLFLVLVFPVAAFLYHYFEKPMMDLRDRKN